MTKKYVNEQIKSFLTPYSFILTEGSNKKSPMNYELQMLQTGPLEIMHSPDSTQQHLFPLLLNEPPEKQNGSNH